tara:strand:+ start:3444 stop:4271 length:828 start_codon:yes stop_codon:yes gene_type:complete
VSTSIFKKSVADFYILVIFVALSVLNIALDMKYANSNYIRILINDLLINPIQYIVETPSNFFNQIMEEKKNIAELNKKIEILEKENIALKANIQKIDILENEVSRLRSIKTTINDKIKDIKIASVIRRNVLPDKESIQINIGSGDTVKIGQTVFGVDGLIGQVVEVNMKSSKVLLITDVKSNVPGIITRTGKQVIVKGRSQDKLLEISFISNDADLKIGDLVSTSGQANRYLPSVKIGRISEVIKNEGERFATVILEPVENIYDTNEVILTFSQK